MTISNDPSLIVHAYVDGELDAVQSLEIERQIVDEHALARVRPDGLRPQLVDAKRGLANALAE